MAVGQVAQGTVAGGGRRQRRQDDVSGAERLAHGLRLALAQFLAQRADLGQHSAAAASRRPLAARRELFELSVQVAPYVAHDRVRVTGLFPKKTVSI